MVRKAPQPDLVDLHVHSNTSDGLLPPREVVRHAAEVRLKAIALTDHDSVAGVAEALAAGWEFGVEVIPGVEVSTEFEPGSCHILGYFIDWKDRRLAELLEEARGGRDRRNEQILERLNALGFALTMADMVGGAPDAVITRAHFAGAMLAKGYVKAFDEAFDKYLGEGKPAYVSRRRVTPVECIQAIHKADGLAVQAHPRQLAFSPAETDAWLEKLAAGGLDGVETQSPDHPINLGRRYRAAAQRLGLLETGGTDWHGRPPEPKSRKSRKSRRANILLGLGRGSMAVHYTLVEAMKQRLAGRRRKK